MCSEYFPLALIFLTFILIINMEFIQHSVFDLSAIKVIRSCIPEDQPLLIMNLFKTYNSASKNNIFSKSLAGLFAGPCVN